MWWQAGVLADESGRRSRSVICRSYAAGVAAGEVLSPPPFGNRPFHLLSEGNRYVAAAVGVRISEGERTAVLTCCAKSSGVCTAAGESPRAAHAAAPRCRPPSVLRKTKFYRRKV